MNILPIYLLALFSILICSILLAGFEKKVKRLSKLLVIPTLCGGLFVYLVGYWPYTGTILENVNLTDMLVSLLRAVFSTGRMFIIENDFNDINEILKNNQFYLLAFGMVHVTALMITAVTAVSLFGERIIISFRLLLKSFQTKYIIYGLNENSLIFAKSLLNAGHKRCVVFITGGTESALSDKAKDLGAIVIDSDIMGLSSLKRIGIRKGINKRSSSGGRQVYLIPFTEDETVNINIVLKVMREIKDPGIQERLHIFVRTKAYSVDQVFDTENQKNGTDFDVSIFDEADIAVRQLMEQNPLYEVTDIDCKEAVVKSDVTVLLAGFGDIGRQALKKIICSSQFVGSRTKYIIVDNNVSNIVGVLKNKHPELMDKYDICMVDADVREERFFDLLRSKAKELNYIVVALGQDSLNIETALGIKDIFDRDPKSDGKQPIIAVNIRNTEELVRYSISEKGTSCGSIGIFGQAEAIFTEDIIINESMDIMARAINTFYNSASPQQANDWHKLSSFTKESNRAAALHIRTKLELVGLKMSKKEVAEGRNEIIDTSEKLKQYLGEKRLNSLAECEHLRWNAFHFTSGWTTWKLEETGKADKPKDPVRRRHACLVAWDALRNVAEAFGKENPEYYQHLDTDQVLHIPDILKEAGYIMYVENDNAESKKLIRGDENEDTCL